MRTNFKLIVATAVCLLWATGCTSSSDYATFVTKTSLSMMDVDTTPIGVSFGYDRIEGYVGPRLEDGSVYPVAGYLDTEGGGITRKTLQVYAGGAAAERIANIEPQDQPTTQDSCGKPGKKPVMLFSAGTSIGLKIGFVEGLAVPNSFSFGFRRKEVSAVPVSIDCKPSILAIHDSDVGGADGQADVGIAQYFATGTVAEALAQEPEIRALFKAGQQAVLSEVEASTTQ